MKESMKEKWYLFRIPGTMRGIKYFGLGYVKDVKLVYMVLEPKVFIETLAPLRSIDLEKDGIPEIIAEIEDLP